MVIDFETAGLDPSSLTALEVAWAITDMDGRQCTPLRSRYCLFSANPLALTHPSQRNPNGPFWNHDGGDRIAKTMAENSGLFDDWLACPPEQRLTSGAQLERLLLDDITTVRDPGDDQPDRERGRAPEFVHITGAGAARFDFSVLARHCAGVTPPRGSKYPTHYRPVDTSIIQTGLLGGTLDAELVQWAVRAYGDEITAIEVDPRPVSYAYQGTLDVTSPTRRHRAAPDVAQSIVIQRALWRFAKPLREALATLAAGRPLVSAVD